MEIYDKSRNRLLEAAEVRVFIETELGFALTDNQWNEWRLGGRSKDQVMRLYEAGSVGKSHLYTEAEARRFLKVLQANLIGANLTRQHVKRHAGVRKPKAKAPISES